MSRGDEKAKPFQFRLQHLFIAILIAAAVSFVWRYDLESQHRLAKEEADRATAIEVETKARIEATLVGSEQGVEFMNGLSVPRAIQLEGPFDSGVRTYDTSLINDLPK